LFSMSGSRIPVQQIPSRARELEANSDGYRKSTTYQETGEEPRGLAHTSTHRIPRRGLEGVIEDFGFAQSYRYPQSDWTRRYAPAPRDARHLTVDTTSMALGRSYDGAQNGHTGAHDEFDLPGLAARRVARTIAARDFKESREDSLNRSVHRSITEQQDEEADQHKRYEQSYGVEATDAIPLGSKEDVAAELIQAAYRGHRVREPKSDLLWRELTAYRTLLSNERKREVALENVLEARSRLDSIANMEVTLGTNRRINHIRGREQRELLKKPEGLSPEEREKAVEELSGMASGCPPSVLMPGSQYGVDYELYWRQVLQEESAYLRENLRELRKLEKISRHAAADAQVHAAELAKARQDSNDELEARATRAMHHAKNLKELPFNYQRVLVGRLVNHGEQWWKSSPSVRLTAQ